MAGLEKKTRYRKGDNLELDRKFALSKKVNLFADKAYDNALSEKEAEALIKIWSKARSVPWNLTVEDVSTLVELYERIMEWRRLRRRSLGRVRKERARKKLRAAAKEGNAEALMKVESIKKADRVKSAKYLNEKQKRRDKVKKC